jgi:hypothetical protein
MRSNTSNFDLLKLLNRTPPWMCRLLARSRNGLKPLSNADIANKAGMARATVDKLNKRQSWDNIPMEIAFRFATACGVNLLNPRPRARVLCSQVNYMKAGTSAQRRMYARLLKPRSAVSTQA